MTAVSKNIYFDVLEILLINTIKQFIELLKWNQLTLYLILWLNTMKILPKKILNSKLVIMSEFQNIKRFLLKDTLQIRQRKFLLSVKLKIQFHGHTWLVAWMVNQFLEVFTKKQKTNQEKIRIKKVLKRKGNKLYGKWKGYHNSFNTWINEKELI